MIFISISGYIGCYPSNNIDGDFTFSHDNMTVQLCIEGCYGTSQPIYQYKYAAIKGVECHCYEDIFSHGEQWKSITRKQSP